MKFHILVEDTARDERFVAEHGFSLLVEKDDHYILHDMGQSDAFVRNAAVMGLNLAKVEHAILSHGHYDHGGGLSTFLELNSKAPVWMAKTAFETHINSARQADIGLPLALANHPRIHFLEDTKVIISGISVWLPKKEPRYPIRSDGLEKDVNGTRSLDDFDHECYFIVSRYGGPSVLISGCAHRGILNLMDWFHPNYFIGGMHLNSYDPNQEDDREKLYQLGRYLAAYPCTYYVGHCTGDAALPYLKYSIGDHLHRIRTGDTIVI